MPCPHNGDLMKAGQPLVDLEPSLSGTDLAKAQKVLANDQLDIARDCAIVDALAGKSLPSMVYS